MGFAAGVLAPCIQSITGSLLQGFAAAAAAAADSAAVRADSVHIRRTHEVTSAALSLSGSLTSQRLWALKLKMGTPFYNNSIFTSSMNAVEAKRALHAPDVLKDISSSIAIIT
jgi:hypothetical protein